MALYVPTRLQRFNQNILCWMINNKRKLDKFFRKKLTQIFHNIKPQYGNIKLSPRPKNQGRILLVLTSKITSLTIVYSTVYSGADQRKHQSSASLAFVLGIHRWLVNSPHKGPVTRKMFPFDDVIMKYAQCTYPCLTSHWRFRHLESLSQQGPVFPA